MLLTKHAEPNSTTKLLQNISTPTRLAELGLSAGKWAGYNLGKPIGRATDASSADDIVDVIIEHSMMPFTPEDLDESDMSLFEKLLNKGFITDHIENAEYNSTFWVIGEGWLEDSLFNIYFSNLSEGMLLGAEKALSELKAESAPNVVSLFKKR